MVSSLVRETGAVSQSSTRWILFCGMAGLVALSGFLLAPGDIAGKTHLVLHGICAQRPSHSLHFGGSTLPLDARMTGMYIAMASSGLWLVAAGRARRTMAPPRSVIVALALCILALAGDGFNALAVDLGLPHSYEPSNALRLATGILGGTSLGVGIVCLFAMSLWARVDRRRAIVARPVELLPPIGIAGVLGILAWSGLPILYAPFAIGLVISAVAVFAVMGMILLALVTDRGWSYWTYRELGPMVCGGIVVATLAIGALAWLRILAESRFGLPQLT